MKMTEVSMKSIRKVDNKELVNMHYRCHQQFTLAKKRNDKKNMLLLKTAHSLIVSEMKRRKIRHNSPLTEYLKHLIF